MAVAMFLTGISISKAENGLVVHLSKEGGSGNDRKYDHKEHVFEKEEGAVPFIEKQVKELIKSVT